MGRPIAFFPFKALPGDCCRIEQFPENDHDLVKFHSRRTFFPLPQVACTNQLQKCRRDYCPIGSGNTNDLGTVNVLARAKATRALS
jgi:hypothetical protein